MSFRIVGADVDPEVVTAILGMTPSAAHAAGEPFPRRPDRCRPTGAWILDSQLPDTAAVNEQVRQLLTVLEPQAGAVRRIAMRGLRPSFLCGVFLSQPQGTIDFDSDTVRRMGTLGAALEIYVFDVQGGTDEAD